MAVIQMQRDAFDNPLISCIGIFVNMFLLSLLFKELLILFASETERWGNGALQIKEFSSCRVCRVLLSIDPWVKSCPLLKYFHTTDQTHLGLISHLTSPIICPSVLNRHLPNLHCNHIGLWNSRPIGFIFNFFVHLFTNDLPPCSSADVLCIHLIYNKASRRGDDAALRRWRASTGGIRATLHV